MSFGSLVGDSPNTVSELLGTYFDLSPSFQDARIIGVGSDGRVVIVETTSSPGDASTVGDDSSGNTKNHQLQVKIKIHAT
eukprot:UN23982